MKKELNGTVVEFRGVRYINTTPHVVNFCTDTGEEFEVPPCGILINACLTEEAVGEKNGVELVRIAFKADPTSEDALREIEEQFPGVIVIGSIIAAQAYPGRVLAMTPCPGFERVAPAEKRMNPFKFTTFEGVK